VEYAPPSEKLKALALQLIEMEDAVIVKRGRAEMKISGEQSGEVLRTVLTLAARGATREEIYDAFPTVHRKLVAELVDHLVARRFLMVEGENDRGFNVDADEENGLDIFYWHFGTNRAEVSARLAANRIRVVGVNLITRQIAASLRASGAQTIPVVDDVLLRNPELFTDDDSIRADRWDAQTQASIVEGDTGTVNPEAVDCIVAAADGGATEQLREWNDFCVLHRLSYLPVLLQDLVGYVGPLVRPGESACFECLRSRQSSHLSDPLSRSVIDSVVDPSVAAFHPSMASILGDLAALEVLKLIGLGGQLARVGYLIEVNFLGQEMKSRRVLKVPRCRVCSSMTKTPATSLSRAVMFPGGGRA
jgi:thiazole/oxazole-forming peptide maturase SagC family component